MITPEQLRKCAMCVYLAAETGPADDISNHLKQAADAIETLQAQLTQQTAIRQEMAKFIDTMAGRELLALELHLPNSVTIKMSQEWADKLLNLPEVRVVLEGK